MFQFKGKAREISWACARVSSQKRRGGRFCKINDYWYTTTVGVTFRLKNKGSKPSNCNDCDLQCLAPCILFQ
jgi:hypothetical protein